LHRQQLLFGLSAEAALEQVANVKPALILMDLQLPGMDGLELTRRLKADPITRDIRVIAVTAYAMKGDEERIRQGGCEAYISKPISVMPFLETVRKHISTPVLAG
jgi:two-component system cell cycle response regulator DivK